MIYRCPYCGYAVRPVLCDGVTTCDNCQSIFSTSCFHKLLSAAWVVRREHICESDFIQHKCLLNEEETQLISHYVIQNSYNHDDFLKKLKEINID